LRQQASSDQGHLQPTPGEQPLAAEVPGKAAVEGGSKLLPSFDYAWQGIVHVVCTQRNMRIHLAIAVAVLVLAATLGLAIVEWAILLLCMVAVIVAEMLNTVVESIVDLVTAQYHPLAKVAKDVAAGAVLVTAIGSAGIGLLVLGPHLWHALLR